MSEEQNRFLAHRIREEWQWMQNNYGDEVTEQDAYDHLLHACRQTPDGDCLAAGSEYCDWECPFRDGLSSEEDDAPHGDGATAGEEGG